MSSLHINEENIEIIQNPHLRIVEDLKKRNQFNGKVIAGEYFGNKYTYEQTFQMFEDYKKAFLSLEGTSPSTITISAPSTISSVNAFYGAMDANKIVNSFGPGFLFAFTEHYMKEFESKTLFILDSFLNEEFINRLHKAGVKNVIVTSITDYMNPLVKMIAKQKGMVPKRDFLDEYLRSGKKLPLGMNFIRLKDFALEGRKIKENVEFPYQENQIAARFLTGATTSKIPKCVEVSGDGFTEMAQIYDKTWFDGHAGDRNAVFIPPFYATGMIHGVHAGLFSGFHNIYKPKYDRFAFGKDLKDSKANIALVAPSHVATLEESNLKDNELSHVKYVFIGGEAIMPAQMEKFRQTAKRLGIKYILNGYGMTETASMSGLSDKNATGDDVTIFPVPGVRYRIIDPKTGLEVGDNQRGVLEKLSPCACLGYTDKELNRNLYTKDNWIHTGDIAIRYSDGRYRVFGRDTDYFKNKDIEYAMFDIEEQVLKHAGVLEAEVIKFSINEEEFPAIVIVPKREWKDRLKEILEYIEKIQVPGINYLIGTRFIDKFKTNPITAKRDYLSLPLETEGYYRLNKVGLVFQNNVFADRVESYFVMEEDLKINCCEDEKVLKK